VQAEVSNAADAKDQPVASPRRQRIANGTTPVNPIGEPILKMSPRGSVTVLPHHPNEPCGAGWVNNWCVQTPNAPPATAKLTTTSQHAVFRIITRVGVMMRSSGLTNKVSYSRLGESADNFRGGTTA